MQFEGVELRVEAHLLGLRRRSLRPTARRRGLELGSRPAALRIGQPNSWTRFGTTSRRCAKPQGLSNTGQRDPADPRDSRPWKVDAMAHRSSRARGRTLIRRPCSRRGTARAQCGFRSADGLGFKDAAVHLVDLINDRLRTPELERPASIAPGSGKRRAGGSSPSSSTTRRINPLPRQLLVSSARARRCSGTIKSNDW